MEAKITLNCRPIGRIRFARISKRLLDVVETDLTGNDWGRMIMMIMAVMMMMT